MFPQSSRALASAAGAAGRPCGIDSQKRQRGAWTTSGKTLPTDNSPMKEFTGMTVRRLQLVIGLFALILPIVASADEPAPPALPETPESPALLYARHDLKRYQQIARPLREQAAAAAAKVKQAEQRLAEAKKVQSDAAAQLAKIDQQLKSETAQREAAKKKLAAAEQSLAKAKKEIESAEKSRAEAEKALPSKKEAFRKAVAVAADAAEKLDTEDKDFDLKGATVGAAEQVRKAAAELAASIDAIAKAEAAKTAASKSVEKTQAEIKQLTEVLARFEKQLAKLSEAKNAVQKNKQAADQQVAKAAEALKPLVEAKTAAEKKAASAEAKVAAVQALVARYEKQPPVADPTAIREILTFKHDRPLISCRFGQYGDFLFAGAQDNRLHRWDLFTSERTDLEGHRSWIRRFAFHPDGQRLLTGGYEGRVIWWNAFDESPAPLHDVVAHKGFCRAVAVSPDGRYVATGGNDAMVRIFSAETGEPVAEISGHERHVYNVAFHPYDGTLVSGDLMGNVKQWEVGTWRHVRDFDAGVLSKYDPTFFADCGGIRGMDISPDGRLLVVSGISEVTNAFAGVGVPTAVLFDMETGRRLAVMKPAKDFRGACWSVRFHPSGRFLIGAGGGSGGSLWFWKPGEQKSFFDFKLPNVAYDIAVHPDGLRIAVALYDKTVRVYSLGPKQ